MVSYHALSGAWVGNWLATALHSHCTYHCGLRKTPREAMEEIAGHYIGEVTTSQSL